MEKLDYVVQRLEDVKESMNKVQEDISSIKIDVAKNTYSLDHHIKRTELNEERISKIEERLTVGYILKLSLAAVSGIGAIAATVLTVYKVIEYLSK